MSTPGDPTPSANCKLFCDPNKTLLHLSLTSHTPLPCGATTRPLKGPCILLEKLLQWLNWLAAACVIHHCRPAVVALLLQGPPKYWTRTKHTCWYTAGSASTACQMSPLIASATNTCDVQPFCSIHRQVQTCAQAQTPASHMTCLCCMPASHTECSAHTSMHTPQDHQNRQTPSRCPTPLQQLHHGFDQAVHDRLGGCSGTHTGRWVAPNIGSVNIDSLNRTVIITESGRV